MSNYKWTSEKIALLHELFPTHKTKELCAVFGCSASIISVQAHYLGIKKTNKWYRIYEIEKLKLSILQSAKLLGVAPSSLNHYISRNNIYWRGKDVKCIPKKYAKPQKHLNVESWGYRIDGTYGTL
jgi:hypothetical protein